MNKTRPLSLLFFLVLTGLFAFNSYADKKTIQHLGGTYTGYVLMNEGNEVPHGQGTITFPDGRKYVGYFKLGEHNGLGNSEMPDGRKYIGDWSSNQRNGYGTSWIPTDGNTYCTYTGEWIQDYYYGLGELDCSDNYSYLGEFEFGQSEGIGIVESTEKGSSLLRATYAGMFEEGETHGLGSTTYGDGQIFVGRYVKGRESNGVYIDSDGTILGTYRDGEFEYMEVSSFVTLFYSDNKSNYEGQVENGIPNGYGRARRPDGVKFVGEFKNGKRHGFGVLTTSDGGKYIGEFRELRVHGFATYFAPDIIYTGEWKKGLQDGYGLIKESGGRHYLGEWKEGKRNGYGRSVIPGVATMWAVWKDDKRDLNFPAYIRLASGFRYEGIMNEKSQPHGQGIATLINGETYEGDFEKNKKHGYGTYTYLNNDVYIGEWKDDNPWNGTRYDKDGNVIGTISDGVVKEN